MMTAPKIFRERSDIVVSETIKAVKAAELEADGIVAKAESDAAAIVEKAKSDAVTLKAEELAGARAQAKKLTSQSDADGEAYISGELSKAREGVATLIESAKAKQSAAVDLVISNLI